MRIAFQAYDFAVLGQDSWRESTREAFKLLELKSLEKLLDAVRRDAPIPKRTFECHVEVLPPWSRTLPRTWVMACFVDIVSDGYSVTIWYFGCIEDFPNREPGPVMLMHAEKLGLEVYTVEWCGDVLVVEPERKGRNDRSEISEVPMARPRDLFISSVNYSDYPYSVLLIFQMLEQVGYSLHFSDMQNDKISSQLIFETLVCSFDVVVLVVGEAFGCVDGMKRTYIVPPPRSADFPDYKGLAISRMDFLQGSSAPLYVPCIGSISREISIFHSSGGPSGSVFCLHRQIDKINTVPDDYSARPLQHGATALLDGARLMVGVERRHFNARPLTRGPRTDHSGAANSGVLA